jgi:hypothetical protein
MRRTRCAAPHDHRPRLTSITRAPTNRSQRRKAPKYDAAQRSRLDSLQSRCRTTLRHAITDLAAPQLAGPNHAISPYRRDHSPDDRPTGRRATRPFADRVPISIGSALGQRRGRRASARDLTVRTATASAAVRHAQLRAATCCEISWSLPRPGAHRDPSRAAPRRIPPLNQHPARRPPAPHQSLGSNRAPLPPPR